MTATTATQPQIEQVAVRGLQFDTQNPRLRGEEGDDQTQQQIFDTLWRDFAVSEVAASIAANGYFEYEPLFVATEGGHPVVVEGNRRLAAVKALIGELTPPAGALPRITKAARDKLEFLPVMHASRSDLWQYIGFKHVNGPQAWRSASKASYIAWVHNDVGVPLDEIARRIGDQHSTVQRFYRALMVVQQAEEADVWQRSDRYKEHFSFSHLYTGLDYSGIQRFVGARPTADESNRPIPKSKFSELGELCIWLFGSKSRNKPPLVQSQNPDLRMLDSILHDRNGVAALRRGLPLRVSEDISKGDSQLLREALVSAKESLQTARGRVLTGYDGQSDLLTLADDIVELGDAISDDLRKAHSKQRRTRRQSAE
jgi:hypothetical protein